jgi:hypothetical protein
MAFGFRECCNEFSYFTLTGIPASVSEFEVYYIRTLEGLNFCATYVQIPTLNYQAPNYILLELTQQQNCDICNELYPCPAEDIILVNQFTAGSVQIDTDCQVNTLQPMIVQCQSVNPTFSNTPDGSVALFVVGGTPPYTFISAGTQDILSVIQTEDIYLLYQNVSAGTYSITTIDSTGDFSITRNCVLSGPPPIPVAVPIVTPASFFNAPDGSIDLNITGGIGPYTVIYEGEQIQLPLTGLLAGNYYFQVIDANEYLIEVVATVTQPEYPNYPTNLCATFTKCGNEFKMSFELTSEFYNYRPIYNCTNPTIFGMTELKLRFETNYGGAQRWVTTDELVQIEDIQFTTPPGVCDLGASTFRMFSTNSGPLILPQGSFKGLQLINNLTVVVTIGGCPPSVRVLSTTNACPGQQGQVVYEASGGSGAPYIFFYKPTGGLNYIQTTATQLTLNGGTYQIKVRDSIGVESTVISFSISSSAVPLGQSVTSFVSHVRSATLTNFVEGPLAEGRQRDFDADIEHFYEFAGLPDGYQFRGKWRISYTYFVRTGDYGYETPMTASGLLVTIEDAWIDNGNGPEQFFVDKEISFSNSNPEFFGSNVYGEENVCVWQPVITQDGCQGGAVTRTSPNKWNLCNIPASDVASFIEGDLRNKEYYGGTNITDNGFIFIDKNSKVYIRIKVKLS